MRASRGQHFRLLYPTMFSLLGSGCSVRYRWIRSRLQPGQSCIEQLATVHLMQHTGARALWPESSARALPALVLPVISAEAQQHVDLVNVPRVQADGVPRLCARVPELQELVGHLQSRQRQGLASSCCGN